MLFDLHVWDRDDWVVLAPIGELDLASAPQLRQAVVQVLGGGARRVVIDLSGVDFLDSLGLGTVVAVLKRIRGLGGDLRLAGASPSVWAPFELTGIDALVPCHRSVDEAIGDG